jgi:hypothetical protein
MGKKIRDVPPTEENDTPFQRFENLAKKIVSTSKPAKSNPSVPTSKNRPVDP